MERTAVGCAMKWSIDLDKSLRSNNPRKRIEAIQQVGARLEWWSKEPELSMAESDMFGLVPGEDKLFANAILLRLAETFISADKQTKLCVVKAFLSELKHRKDKSYNRKSKGILSKYKVENHLELLRRVKVCFNSGDEDVRAMALALFGCWSDFAKDNADIRYLILSSIVSSHALEVKASLFAAGCFCELSDDFARVLLEMLVNMVSSSDVAFAGRIAGVRAFAKLGSSSALCSKAYEEGTKLILAVVEDDMVMSMLISLTIITSRSAFLIARQVDLLLTYLSQDKSSSLRATSLRCLHILLSRSRFRFSPPTELISAMFDMLNVELPPVMQNDALHILYEILISKILSFSYSEVNAYFTKILTVVKIILQSPSILNRLFAMRFLGDISVKTAKRRDMTHDGDDNTPVSRTISFLMTRITLLVNSVPALNQPDMETEQEIWTILKTMNLLINECPDIGELALHKLHTLISCLLNKDGRTLSHGWSKLVLRVSKVMDLCLRTQMKDGPLSSEVHNVARRLIENVGVCSYFNCYVHSVYHLLLHPYTSCNELDRDLITSDHAYLIKNEILALENAKKSMAVKEYWSSYKTGKYAAFQGAWFTAAFIFGELVTMVQSDSSRHWLTSLTLFSYSEMRIQCFSLPKERSILLGWLDSNRSSELPVVQDLGETDERSTLDGVCNILRSSKECLLTNDVTPSGRLYFQIQFLTLRADVMENVVDIYKVVEEHNVRSNNAASLVQLFTLISTRLMKLAREYDLVATSYISMDPTSRMIVSAHALSCSVLAFVAGFSLFFLNLDFGNSNFHAMLVHDLVMRLWYIDRESSNELLLLLKTCFGRSQNFMGPPSKSQRLENTSEVRNIAQLCCFAVKGVVGLKNVAKRMSGDDDDEIHLQIVNDGLTLQRDVARKWLCISLRTPMQFFRVRPCVSCQLFAMNRDSGNVKNISVLKGYHLHLDLCLQLNDILSESRVRLTKLYCILQCKTSYQHLVDDNMIELNDKIVKYVNKCDKDHTFDGQIAETIVCFRPNGNGQGFSTCILDVSMFPLGSYEIKWRAGCLDIDGCYWSLNSLNSGPVFTVQ
nr:ARM repeat superfamily protein [Tanacetum cinerariifolium]